MRIDISGWCSSRPIDKPTYFESIKIFDSKMRGWAARLMTQTKRGQRTYFSVLDKASALPLLCLFARLPPAPSQSSLPVSCPKPFSMLPLLEQFVMIFCICRIKHFLEVHWNWKQKYTVIKIMYFFQFMKQNKWIPYENTTIIPRSLLSFRDPW